MILWAGGIEAQQPFERFYYSTEGYQRNLIELSSHNIIAALAWRSWYFFAGSSSELPSVNAVIGVIRFLQLGSIHNIPTMSSISLQVIARTLVSDGVHTIPYTRPAIGRMDSLGNILSLQPLSP